MTTSGPRTFAYWCQIPSRPNFGDGLTPWLITRLTGRAPHFRAADDPRPKLIITGSVLAQAGPAAIVWGAGIMSKDDKIAPGIDIRAVRGPLSRARALDCGANCPPVVGDPALLLPRIYSPTHKRANGIGLALHFADAPWAGPLVNGGPDLKLIDIQRPVERVIDDLTACRAVASSSLHAIIAAHAYGVPTLWLRLRPLPSGDGTKFADYFASVGLEPDLLECPPDRIDPDEVAARARLPAFLPDLDALWNNCPLERLC